MTSAIARKNLKMSVWVGSHGVRYSDDFRRIIYEINPVYLPCVYKEMFENNATNTLRDADDAYEDDRSIVKQKDNGNLKTNGRESAGSIPIRCLSAFEQKKNGGINGWDICSVAHSSTNVNCSTSKSDETVKQRSHSAIAKLITQRSEISSANQSTVKRGSGKLKDRIGQIKSSIDGVTSNQESIGKTQEPQRSSGSTFNTPGYSSRPTSPIQYKFAHFEYTENYIEQYRQEYTMRKLEQLSINKTKQCLCGRTQSTTITTVPMMPIFCKTERCFQGSFNPRVINSYHTDTKVIKAKHEAAKKKPYGLKTTQQRQQNSQESQNHNKGVNSPHQTFGRDSFLTSPLIIDNYIPVQRGKSPAVCRSRPFLPNTSATRIVYPNSANTIYRDCSRK